MDKALSEILPSVLIKDCALYVYSEHKAAEEGLLWVLKLHREHNKGYLIEPRKLAKLAINGNHFEVFRWLLEVEWFSDYAKNSVIKCVVKTRPQLRWIELLDKVFVLDKKMSHIIVEWTLGGNCLEVFEYLHSKDMLKGKSCKQILKNSMKGGHIEVFEWAVATLLYKVDEDYVFKLCNITRDPKMVKCLCHHVEDIYKKRMFDNAAENGDLELAKWIHATFHIEPNTDTYRRAIHSCHLDVLTWIKIINPSVNLDNGTCEFEGTWLYPWNTSHFKTFQWLHKNDLSSLKRIGEYLCPQYSYMPVSGFPCLDKKEISDWMEFVGETDEATFNHWVSLSCRDNLSVFKKEA